MNDRRLVGIDLGIATAHTVRVLDGEGSIVAKRKASPAAESLSAVETAALAGCPAGTRLEVVIEPTGPAWLPIAVFFSARGHRVFRVSSQKAADLRRFLSRHAKSNGIDADTLARLPLFDPAGLRPLQLPGAQLAALDRRVRATDRLTRAGAEHKLRIRDLVRQLLPMSPLSSDLGAADLAVLERYADPRALARAGQARLTALIARASHGHQGAERARQWLDAARASLELYAGPPRRQLHRPGRRGRHRGAAAARHHPAELAAHAAERENRYRQVDPAALARSLPGLADVGGPALAACMGDPAPLRPRQAVALLHRPGPQGVGDRGHRPQGPAHVQGRILAAAHHPGPRRRPRPQARPPAGPHLLPADDRAWQRPPRRASAWTAACLAERAWTVMRRGTPYIICDTDGRPVTPRQASTIIGERWTVPPEVRARRRSKKTGKAPRKSPKDSTHGAASPAAPLHPTTSAPSSRPLDNRSSIGNQR